MAGLVGGAACLTGTRLRCEDRKRELCYAVDWARLFCDGMDKIDTGERGGGKEKKEEREKKKREEIRGGGVGGFEEASQSGNAVPPKGREGHSRYQASRSKEVVRK